MFRSFLRPISELALRKSSSPPLIVFSTFLWSPLVLSLQVFDSFASPSRSFAFSSSCVFLRSLQSASASCEASFLVSSSPRLLSLASSSLLVPPSSSSSPPSSSAPLCASFLPSSSDLKEPRRVQRRGDRQNGCTLSFLQNLRNSRALALSSPSSSKASPLCFFLLQHSRGIRAGADERNLKALVRLSSQQARRHGGSASSSPLSPRSSSRRLRSPVTPLPFFFFPSSSGSFSSTSSSVFAPPSASSSSALCTFFSSRLHPLPSSSSSGTLSSFLPSSPSSSLSPVDKSSLPFRRGVYRLSSCSRPVSTNMSSQAASSAPPSSASPSSSLPVFLDQVPSQVKLPVPVYGCGSHARTRISALVDGGQASILKFVGEDKPSVTVCGWSRSVRKQGGGSLCFVVLNDGSSVSNLQVVVESTVGGDFEKLLKCGAGSAFRFVGDVVKSPAKGQAVELLVKDASKGHHVELIGFADASKYPLAKKEHTREYLREIAHLRPRSYLIGAAMRVRSQLAMATHRFFQDRGFQYIHTPIITASDCEGAGEMFQVTTLLPPPPPPPLAASSSKSTPAAKREDTADSTTALTNGGGVEEAKKDPGLACCPVPLTKDKRGVDYSKDFFGRPAFLTVSGQLAVEPYCCAMSDVYTFGPTFRAENSHTSRHLAEFWMVEPEIAFATLEDNMNVAEAYVRYSVQWVLDNCRPDIEWFAKNQEEGLIARLENILAEPFGRVSYTDAIEMLKAEEKTANFKEKVEWGMDLASEHERYLTEKIFKKPCIVFNYPKEIKAFYMKLNEDGKTVRAMDVLVPKIGELIGGSQREDDRAKLDAMIEEKKLDLKAYWWYRDLREFGTMPHAGFGLGFERLVMLVTGIENIRDTIPYPRYPGHAEF